MRSTPDLINRKHKKEEENVETKVKELEDLKNQTKALVQSLRKDIAAYQHEADVRNSELMNLKFDYERSQVKKMGIWWWATIVLLIILKYHSYAHRHIFSVVFCEISFIYNLRLLYTNYSQSAGLIGFFSIIYTIFFV